MAAATKNPRLHDFSQLFIPISLTEIVQDRNIVKPEIRRFLMEHKRFKEFGFACVGIVLVVLLAGGSPVGLVQAQDSNRQGNGHNDDDRDDEDRCADVSDSHRDAHGKSKKCRGKGSSSGIARGDFNGDGIADLAIGIPGKDAKFPGIIAGTTITVTDAGAVQIIYGTAANGLVATGGGVPASQLITELYPFTFLPFNLVDEKAEVNDNFGATLASGDFNGDGFSDLAVGIPGESVAGTTGRGAVMVFMGSANGLSSSPSNFFAPANFYTLANPGNPHAATSLTWGDFNGDGFGDLAVASDYTGDFVTQIGAVTVLFGSSTGLTTVGKLHLELEQLVIASHPTVPLVLSAGDFNRDGKSDLVAGSPTTDQIIPCSPQPCTSPSSPAGAVHLLYGSANGLANVPCVAGSSPTACHQFFSESIPGVPGGGPLDGEQFGAAVAVGDFNHDSFDDLAIGVPGENSPRVSSRGAVIIIPGSFFGLQAVGTPGAQVFAPQISTGNPNVLPFPGTFGASLASGDFDGDNFKDLAVGAPTTELQVFSTPCHCFQTRSAAGMVEVIFGSPSGLSLTVVRPPQILTQDMLGETIESGDQFGTALTAWNFGKSPQADLAIGVPFEDVGNVTDAGLVHVVYGSTTGLTVTGSQIWTENSPGLNNTAVAGDHFGLTLY
jgi:hypothetical protein